MKLFSIFKVAALTLFALFSLTGFAAHAQQEEAKAHVQGDISNWVGDPLLIAAIKAQNAANASLDQVAIDAKDKAWREEVKAGGGAMTAAVLGNDVSAFLKHIRDNSGGLYTEIILMDDKGLNVGQSDLTSDYWQGDEAKWQKTFLVGPDAIDVSEVEFDESSQTYQVQVSVAVSDPATGHVIGAVTIGLNAELL